MSGVVYTEATQRRVLGVFRDVVRSRELLLDLAWKDLRVRYRYAFMGFLWAVLEPLAMMLILTFVFTVIFGDKVAVLRGESERPFAVELLCGIVPWLFLSNALTNGTRSLVDDQNLITKVYFTREVVPLASVITCLVNLLIGFVVLVVVHAAFGGALGLGLVWFAVVFAIQFVMVVGLALLLSCMHVYFRDVGYLVGVALIFGFYASPILYRLERVLDLAPKYPWLVRIYLVNPMAELIAAYRQILFENRFPDAALLLWPCVVALLCLAVGVVVFRRNSPLLSDYL